MHFQHVENILFGSILSFVITFYSIPVIILVANWKKLYDLPGDRKIHSAPVPSLGGLGIFVGFMLGVLLFTNAQEVFGVFQYFIACFIVIFFFGIKDDILMLSPMKKFMGQMAVVAILMFKANLLITNMYGFLNITYIDPAVSYLLTGFTILVVMNAYNLIDGVDGLAGSLSVITCLSFGTFFLLSNDIFYALLGYSFAASLMAFLIYNYSPARIFMGDTGAMLAGAVNAILVIRFIETGEQSQILPILTTPAIGFGILMIPLLDTLRVFAIRILHGRSPFSPDRNHVHHLMLDRGYSHRKITLLLSGLSILFIFLSYFAMPLGTTKVIGLQVLVFFLGIGVLKFYPKRNAQMRVIKGSKLDRQERLRRSVRNFLS
ncbi:MAG: hypothetical protein RIR90_624 [Bacteroidota bacterium]